MFPERLTKGYRAFLDGRFAVERGRYQTLAGSGQSPSIMVIGCVDSRVSPEVIFDAAPGELLVARNVANLVPPMNRPPRKTPATSTAPARRWNSPCAPLRCATSWCWAMPSAAASRPLPAMSAPLSSSDFIGRWMSQIAPAAEAIGPQGGEGEEGYLRKLEFASVELSLKNLMTFPFVQKAVEAGELDLHGAYFGVASGRLLGAGPQDRPVRGGLAFRSILPPGAATASRRPGRPASHGDWRPPP